MNLRKPIEREAGQKVLDKVRERMQPLAKVCDRTPPPLFLLSYLWVSKSSSFFLRARDVLQKLCSAEFPCALSPPELSQVLEQGNKKPHPVMMDILMMPLPETIKQPET